MLAILPAGGSSRRFEGTHKELLPDGQGGYLLSNAIRRSVALGATRFLVISSAEKAAAHSRFLAHHCGELDVTLTVRREFDVTLWSALSAVLPLCEDRNLLVLPDTAWTCRDEIPDANLSFGVFTTEEPERFSVLKSGRIHTKEALTSQKRWVAWGAVYWSKLIAQGWTWREREHGAYSGYDEALQEAMQSFTGYRMFGLDDYRDLGTPEHYLEYMRR